MNSKKGSECVTRGIRISVMPEFIPGIYHGQKGKNLFSYLVTISNESDDSVVLQSRHWIIIDADGSKEEIDGDGVIGYKPELKPGTSFTYSSFCPLNTEWGTMEGRFTMLRKDGSEFDAEIKRFYLVKEEPRE